MTQYATQLLIGQQVTFTSKSSVDQTRYVGVLEALITYSLAPQFGDIVSYNADVQRADPSVGAPSTLTYFIVKLANGQPAPTTRVFSDAWVAPGSWDVIQAAEIFNFNIYDLTGGGAANILAVLKAAGYNAVQVTDPAALALTSALGTTSVAQTIV